MRTLDDIIDIVDLVQLDGTGHFHVRYFEGQSKAIYIQHYYERPDALTGETGWGYGRKWHVSPHATESEIVLTCLKAAITDAEHEVREGFRYKGVAVFQPHVDVNALAEAARHSDARPAPRDEAQRALIIG